MKADEIVNWWIYPHRTAKGLDFSAVPVEPAFDIQPCARAIPAAQNATRTTAYMHARITMSYLLLHVRRAGRCFPVIEEISCVHIAFRYSVRVPSVQVTLVLNWQIVNHFDFHDKVNFVLCSS